MFAVVTKLPQEEHIDLLNAADISFSYFLIEDRICEWHISGGNFSEALVRRSNSSFNKPTASFKASSSCVCSYFSFFEPSLFE
jgi:hypothetical protein